MNRAILTITNPRGKPTITKEMAVFLSRIAANIDEDATVTIDDGSGQTYTITADKEVKCHA